MVRVNRDPPGVTQARVDPSATPAISASPIRPTPSVAFPGSRNPQIQRSKPNKDRITIDDTPNKQQHAVDDVPSKALSGFKSGFVLPE
jgi:hypothetical protein